MTDIVFQMERIPENFNESRYLLVLNKDEKLLYETFSDVFRKKQFLFSRFLLKNKLYEITGQDADKIYFETSTHGKPFIQNSRIHFSLSHSGSHVAYVIAKKPIGLDIQIHRTFSNLNGLIQKVCHPNEIEILSKISDLQNKEKEFLKIWTVKEAYSKCAGEGFQIGFKEVDISSLKDLSETNFKDNKNISYQILYRLSDNLSISICKLSQPLQ